MDETGCWEVCSDAGSLERDLATHHENNIKWPIIKEIIEGYCLS